MHIGCTKEDCDGYHLKCRCEVKVSKQEIKFLIDQRTTRQLHIERVDWGCTKAWWRRNQRDERNIEARVNEQRKRKQENEEINESNNVDIIEPEIEVVAANDEYIPKKMNNIPGNGESEMKQGHNTRPLPKLAAMSDRYSCVQ